MIPSILSISLIPDRASRRSRRSQTTPRATRSAATIRISHQKWLTRLPRACVRTGATWGGFGWAAAITTVLSANQPRKWSTTRPRAGARQPSRRLADSFSIAYSVDCAPCSCPGVTDGSPSEASSLRPTGGRAAPAARDATEATGKPRRYIRGGGGAKGEPEEGIEPSTPCLPCTCSTTELLGPDVPMLSPIRRRPWDAASASCTSAANAPTTERSGSYPVWDLNRRDPRPGTGSHAAGLYGEVAGHADRLPRSHLRELRGPSRPAHPAAARRSTDQRDQRRCVAGRRSRATETAAACTGPSSPAIR